MTQTVAVKQSGSVFSVSETELSFEKAGGSKTVKVNGTNGLPWTVSPDGETNGITPDIKSSEANGMNQTLTFSATENAGGARSATFTIAVPGGDHSKTVEVKQASDGIYITIDQSVLPGYIAKAKNDLKGYPPFNKNGTDWLPGCSFNGIDTMTGSYTIEVEKGEKTDPVTYINQVNYCNSLNQEGTGWRMPTQIELYAMCCKYREAIESTPGASPFVNGGYYWSSSVSGGVADIHTRVIFYSGDFNGAKISGSGQIRCVRDI